MLERIKLETRIEAQQHVSKEGKGGPSRETQIEIERSLNWLHESETDIQSELTVIRKRLDDIKESLRELEIAVEELQEYSNSFNIKIFGVPELSTRRGYKPTLC